MKNVISVLSAIFLSGSVLVSCSSGNNDGPGGLSVGGITLPACDLGVGEFAGCWISEYCATDHINEPGVLGVRLIEVATETATHPQVEGTIRSYYLMYKNEQCTGDAIKIIDMHEELKKQGMEINWSYVQQPDTVCSETGGTLSLLCNALDITVSSFLGDSTGMTTQLIAGERLCMPTHDYDFDSTAIDAFGDAGGIGAGLENERNTVLNLLPGQCLNRFTH